MKAKIIFLEHVFEEVKVALKWDGRERAVYLLCHSSAFGDSIKLMPWKVFRPEEKDYVSRSAGHYTVKKKFINTVLEESVKKQSHIMQVHIHPHDPARFSAVDMAEEPKFMRHIAEKIEGLVHVSMVFSNSMDTIDAWVYDRSKDTVIPVQKILVIGRRTMDMYIPPRSGLANVELAVRFDRTVRAFGKDAVKKLNGLDVGVVGASALGGPVLEFLSRDGAGSVTVCDMDRIEETNLNRLPGTTPRDIGTLKVDFYKTYIERINPEMQVKAFSESFYEETVQECFSQCDILLGCVDSGARLSMNRLALANCIPYFDMGAGIYSKKEIEFIGGQVYSVIPGREHCLSCTGVFNDLMAEFNSPEHTAQDRSQGYFNDRVESPLVHFLDSIIAGLGYLQMLKYVWGFEKDEIFKVHFDGLNKTFMPAGCPNIGCLSCQVGGYLGTGDKVPFMVPAKDDDEEIINAVASVATST